MGKVILLLAAQVSTPRDDELVRAAASAFATMWRVYPDVTVIIDISSGAVRDVIEKINPKGNLRVFASRFHVLESADPKVTLIAPIGDDQARSLQAMRMAMITAVLAATTNVDDIVALCFGGDRQGGMGDVLSAAQDAHEFGIRVVVPHDIPGDGAEHITHQRAHRMSFMEALRSIFQS